MIRSTDKRFKQLEVKIGLFLACALVGCLGVIIFLGAESDLFASKYELRFTVDKGTGFSTGMPVKLSGFRIGRITAIVLNEQAQVDITMQIVKKYQKWIRADSYVKQIKEGFVGDTIIEISAGDQSLPILEDKDSIAYIRTRSMEEHVEQIASKVTPALSELRDIISYVNNSEGDIKKSLRNIQAISENLGPTHGKIDHLLDQTAADLNVLVTKSARVLEQANKSLSTLDSSIQKLDNTITLLDEKIPAMVTKMDSTLKNFENLSANLQQISTDTSQQIPALLDNTNQVLYKTDELLDATQQMWPFKNHINSDSKTKLIKVDSND